MWSTKTNLLIYGSHFLSSWGNNMWTFGMGMYLVRIADDTIQLSATSGLVTGLAIFFFGPLVGDWVDRTKRLKAVQLSVLLQDLLMLCCFSVVAVYLWFKDDLLSHAWLSPLLQVVIVSLGVFSSLAAQAKVIAVERDWIVEICDSDHDHLASLTAMLRRIDQVSAILAPMTAGQVMTYLSLVFSAFLISGWNILSLLLEMFLIWKVYKTVPALKARKDCDRVDGADMEAESNLSPTHNGTATTTTTFAKSPGANSTTCQGSFGDAATEHRRLDYLSELLTCDGDNASNMTTKDVSRHSCNISQTLSSQAVLSKPDGDLQLHGQQGADQDSTAETPGELFTRLCPDPQPNVEAAIGNVALLEPQTRLVDQTPSHSATTARLNHDNNGNNSNSRRMVSPEVEPATAPKGRGLLYHVVALYRGWRTYSRYRVSLAGLALAFLYMTVLSFHSTTVAYAVTQGLSESVVGILMGTSAVFGIVGTFAYTIIRRRVGLPRTGFIALTSQVSSLTLCIVSIWLPGSPFDPFYTERAAREAALFTYGGRCGQGDEAAAVSNNGSFFQALANGEGLHQFNVNFTSGADVLDCSIFEKKAPSSYLSVGFLMAGIFLGRIGVWVADLTITQLFLEDVVPSERGVVHGVQSSLNQLMDLLKYAVVVALPDIETYGFLIIISFCFIATAWLMYTIYLRRERVDPCGGDRSKGVYEVSNKEDEEVEDEQD